MYDPNIHRRKSIRLPEYIYSTEGFYFITICTQDKKCIFGKVVNGEMILNEAGRIVKEHYNKLGNKYPNIKCHTYTIMPNHFHCIIQIVGAGLARPNTSTNTPINKNSHADERAGKPRPYNPTLGHIIGYFKYQTTKEINLPFRLWQRNYYEHIIRNQHTYDEIEEYILNNPFLWEKDKLYTEQNV